MESILKIKNIMQYQPAFEKLLPAFMGAMMKKKVNIFL
jgi:hypothetical protein